MLEQLGITTSNFLNRIVAKNENAEIILKYNQWKSNYVGNGNFGISEEIPRIEGAELLIRDDYFQMIKCFLNKNLLEYTTAFLELKDVPELTE